MEHYNPLHVIEDDDLFRLQIDVLYLDRECWMWWQWLKKFSLGFVT
jgi:hypothetical protein